MTTFRVPPAFTPRGLRNPAMAETRPGSVFTPAIGAWSSPGALGGLGALPSWTNYAAAAGFLALGAMKKLSWPMALAGAALSYYLLGTLASAGTQITSGTGLVSNGPTIQFTTASPGTLTTAADGTQTITVGGIAYTVQSTATNPDGSIQYTFF